MPHDANGSLLQKGDKVVAKFVIDEISQNENECNITLKSIVEVDGRDVSTSFWLNSKQTVKEAS